MADRLRVVRPRPRVTTLVAGAVTAEGPWDPGPGWAPDKVAVMAHWSARPDLSRSVTTLVDELLTNDYAVLVVSTAEVAEPLRWPQGSVPDGVAVLRRPNAGYDFGSWAVALDRFPMLAGSSHVLLLNDSMVGPFRPLAPLLADFSTTAADVWGLTDTSQFGHHVQSYFLGFKDRVLTEGPLKRFWQDVRVEPTKEAIIHRYEIGLSRLLRRQGFVTTVAFPYQSVVKSGTNPVIMGWQRLLELGFPFVKRELVTAPDVAPDGRRVPSVVQRLVDEEVSTWL